MKQNKKNITKAKHKKQTVIERIVKEMGRENWWKNVQLVKQFKFDKDETIDSWQECNTKCKLIAIWSTL